MLIRILTISDKGQIVIPKEFVRHLGSKLIKLEIADTNEVRITPVRDVAGSLSKFTNKLTSDDFKNVKEQAWDKAITKKIEQV